MAARRITSATTSLNGNEFSRAAAVRPGRDRPVRAAALQVRQRGLDARRSGAHSGHGLQQGPQQAVLLLLAGHSAAHRSRRPEPAPDADRTRAQGRLLADVRRRRAASCSSAIRCCRATASDDAAGRRASRATSSRPDRFDAVGSALLNLFPLPNADDPTGGRQYNYVFQTVQDWPRNDQVLRDGLERRAADDGVRPAAVGIRKARRRRVVPRLDGRGLAAAAEQVRDRHGQLRQHAAAHLQPDHLRRIHRRRELGAPVHERARPGARSTSTTAPWCCRRSSSSSRRRTRTTCCRRRASPAAYPGTIGSFNVESRWPFFGYNTLFNFSGNITKVKGAHNMKTGLFVEHTTRPAQRSSTFNGIAELQHGRVEPAATRTSDSPTRCSAR